LPLDWKQNLQQATFEQASKGAEGVAALIDRAANLSNAMSQSLQLSVSSHCHSVLSAHLCSADCMLAVECSCLFTCIAAPNIIPDLLDMI